MKKLLIASAACIFMLASCNTVTSTRTATTVKVPTVVSSVNVADLEVGPRVTFTYNTQKNERMGRTAECAAVAAMLEANGNADVLVAPEYKYDNDRKVIIVTGRPAKYKNFRGAN
ncbi:MAG: hypothetical protein NC097_03625 [Clostridium sp.]|nr:hypothetical protein [Prevotella sp.]MCM1428867.1 hypothetical protein [Clostridium sp.]MCM1475246.1 hypothetical protein [Muribaculaceae bacterium]